MPFARIGDLDICYERAGAGPPLLYISGTGGDLRKTPRVMDGPLPQTFDTLAYDQRGLGRTTKPDRPYTMADYADDAARMIDFAGWDAANVIGYSFGGMVAQELVLRHPGKVRRLVLAATSPGGAGGASFAFHEVGLVGEAMARHMIPIADRRRDAAWAATNPAEVKALVALGADAFAGEPGHAMGARRQIMARAGHDTWERLPTIACPVLIAGGRYDGIAPLDRQEAMAGRIPGARLALFEGGHPFMMQDAAALPAIVDFLKER
jgi:3-oxoadipate enol-lactonase